MQRKSDALPFEVRVRHVYIDVDVGIDEYEFTTSSLNDILSLWQNPASRYQQFKFDYKDNKIDFTSYSQYTSDFILSSSFAFVTLIDKLPKGLFK